MFTIVPTGRLRGILNHASRAVRQKAFPAFYMYAAKDTFQRRDL